MKHFEYIWSKIINLLVKVNIVYRRNCSFSSLWCMILSWMLHLVFQSDILFKWIEKGNMLGSTLVGATFSPHVLMSSNQQHYFFYTCIVNKQVSIKTYLMKLIDPSHDVLIYCTCLIWFLHMKMHDVCKLICLLIKPYDNFKYLEL